MEIAIIAGLVFLVDRLTKIWIVNHFFLGESWAIVPNVFHFTYILNRGAAFGLFINRQSFFLCVAVAVVLFIIIFLRRIRQTSRLMQAGIGLLVGGALGNAYDRWTIQAVIDFIDFRIWPIFNVADIAICIGVALIIYYLWEDKELLN